jgi:hypothetical protein
VFVLLRGFSFSSLANTIKLLLRERKTGGIDAFIIEDNDILKPLRYGQFNIAVTTLIGARP